MESIKSITRNYYNQKSKTLCISLGISNPIGSWVMLQYSKTIITRENLKEDKI